MMSLVISEGKTMNLSHKISLVAFVFFLISSDIILAQQISIRRIEQMPDLPSPYCMRNWKQVSLGYDSLVFDFDRTGQYLPLVFRNTNTVNYPGQESFGLHTVVGTPHTSSAEAINVLPAVISASLVGIDKSNQHGRDWVLMCQEFFNNRTEENVYLNNPVTSSGSDWWYETMPNIFFYQLYDLYPGTGDFDYQFRTVADRWLEAVVNMDGSATPWQQAYMDYRAWALSTMTPLTVGVKEPEAAGAIGWLLYHAFRCTGEVKYRLGAEWAMEFLSSRSANPSYELQLPYGAYIAARMNAELGTRYDVEKLLNWCFDPSGNERNWGSTKGRWGEYDCFGLIGEAKYAGYAFIMNGFEQAGALVPILRYDDRFAQAIGKWMLNCANATRLFYAKYLPDNQQDSEEWSHVYDPKSYIAHEAMREYDLESGISPFATGDFIRSGWGPTNLALYGSSHVGLFGGIIDTTDIRGILRLDVLKTDFFDDPAFPTFLYFNPYDEEKTVSIDVGGTPCDLYDAVTNDFVKISASGNANFTLPGRAAMLLVSTPAGGNVTYELDKMRVDDVIVDYRSGHYVANYPPRIKALTAQPLAVVIGTATTLYCTAADRDGDLLSFLWRSDAGNFAGNGSEVTWTAPHTPGQYTVRLTVQDGKDGIDSAGVSLQVVPYINHAPVIDSLTAFPRTLQLGTPSRLTCHASDADNDTLEYAWSTRMGTLTSEGSRAIWIAPNVEGFFYVSCQVSDRRDGVAADSIGIVVRDTSKISTGFPIAFYPFNGNANDESGYDHHGLVKGATLAANRFGTPKSAYFFNGQFDLIQVPNKPSLNFQEAITVSLWLNVSEFYDYRESYPISHGNWESRWKLSISPDRTLRWTVKSNRGIKDLDSQTVLQKDVWYNITALYDGENFDLYVNGVLDNHSTFSGKINTTVHDLTIGQVLPGNPEYNFKGILDDIRIYRYALSEQEILNIHAGYTAIERKDADMPGTTRLFQNYPNPFNDKTSIAYQLHKNSHVLICIYNMLGQRVRTLENGIKPSGSHVIQWDGRDDTGAPVTSGIYFCELTSGNQKHRNKLAYVR